MLIALALAWRWEWVGAILFVALGAWYIAMAWGKVTWTTYLLIAGPSVLIGVMFLVNWLLRAELRSSTRLALELTRPADPSPAQLSRVRLACASKP